MALDVLSRLNTNGSAVNIGRENSASGTGTFDESPLPSADPVDGEVAALGGCITCPGHCADATLPEAGVDVGSSRSPIDICRRHNSQHPLSWLTTG